MTGQTMKIQMMDIFMNLKKIKKKKINKINKINKNISNRYTYLYIIMYLMNNVIKDKVNVEFVMKKTMKTYIYNIVHNNTISIYVDYVSLMWVKKEIQTSIFVLYVELLHKFNERTFSDDMISVFRDGWDISARVIFIYDIFW